MKTNQTSNKCRFTYDAQIELFTVHNEQQRP